MEGVGKFERYENCRMWRRLKVARGRLIEMMDLATLFDSAGNFGGVDCCNAMPDCRCVEVIGSQCLSGL